MNDLEKIKLEARKEELSEQQENAAKITQKVETVSNSKKTMEDSDKLAREALDNLREAKKASDILKGDFEKIISDVSVKKYLEKRGVTTIEEYIASNEGKDTDIAKRYKDINEQIPSSREGFRSKIKERGQAKDELLNELKKNETEEQLRGDKEDGIRTYSKLKNNAKEQIKEIPEKEIKVLVDSLIDQRREKLKNIFLDIINLKPNTTDLISNEDIIELQKYGTKYYLIAEDMFKDRIIELATETLNSSIDEVYDNLDHNQNIERTKESFKEARIDWIKTKLKIDSKGSKEDVFSEQRSLDNIIATKEIIEKLDEIKPEIEDIFSRAEKDLEKNHFYNLIQGFFVGQNNKVFVEFKRVVENPFMEDYLGYIPSSESAVYLDSEKLTITIPRLTMGRAKNVSEIAEQKGKVDDFKNKGFFYRISKKDEGVRASKKLNGLREKGEDLKEFEKILFSLSKFTSELDTAMKDQSIKSLRFDIYTGGNPPELMGLKKMMLDVIDDYKKQLNQYI